MSLIGNNEDFVNELEQLKLWHKNGMLSREEYKDGVKSVLQSFLSPELYNAVFGEHVCRCKDGCNR